jgi:hypothetical protein
MPEEDPRPTAEPPEDEPTPETASSGDVRTTDPDEIFADWSDIRLGRAVPYLAALLAAAFGLVLVLILIGIL